MREFYRLNKPVKLFKQNNTIKEKKNGRGRGKDCYKIKRYLSNNEMIFFGILIQANQVWEKKGHFADNWKNVYMEQVSEDKGN